MGRIVVITGAGRGLGLTLANEFATHEWRVIGTGRSEKPVDYPAGTDYQQCGIMSIPSIRNNQKGKIETINQETRIGSR